jgi:hypothetical protein
MDDTVLRAMARWPDVPAVYGWLRLNRRGDWLIKGQRIANSAVAAFIGRNYCADERGRWFFQNGPQRVFAALDYTPLVYRVGPGDGGFTSHTGAAARHCDAAWIDEKGFLLLRTEHGAGVVADRDLPHLLPHLAAANGVPLDEAAIDAALARGGGDTGLILRSGGADLPVGAIRAREVPRRFGFDPDPRPAAGEPEC